MSTSLHALAKHPNAIADIIFVHGLGGDSQGTWTAPNEEKTFWPQWIYDDFSQTDTPCSVWMLDYPAAATNWTGRGNAMALPERAENVIQYLTNEQIGKKPVIFVAHSLGGLLTKYILQNGSESADNSHRELAQRTCAVVFLATPHRGSNLASLMRALRISRPTVAVEDLRAHSPYLNELDMWYRNNVEKLRIRTFALRENKKITSRFLKYLPGPSFWVVDPTSADPNIAGSPVIAIDADHFEICKPKQKEVDIYVNVRAFLKQSLNDTDVLQRATDLDLMRFLGGVANDREQCYCVLSSFEDSITNYQPHWGGRRDFRGATVSPHDTTAVAYLFGLVSGVRSFTRLAVRTSEKLADEDRSNHLLLIGSSLTNTHTDWALSLPDARYKFVLTQPDKFSIQCPSCKEEWIPNDGDASLNTSYSAGQATQIDYAIVQRLQWDQFTIFVLAGLGPIGTQGAAYFMYRNWYRLYKEYKDNPFGMILRFGTRTQRAAFNDAIVVHRTDPVNHQGCIEKPLN